MIKIGDFILSDFLKESTDSSSKRLVLFIAAFSMALGIILLTIASFFIPIPPELMWALTIPLSGMAGLSYSTVESMRIKNSKDKEKNQEENLWIMK